MVKSIRRNNTKKADDKKSNMPKTEMTEKKVINKVNNSNIFIEEVRDKKQTKKPDVNKDKEQLKADNKLKEIKSLKQLEEKILEKFEEHKFLDEQIPKLESEKVTTETIIPAEKIKSDNDSRNPDYKTRIEAILFAVGKYLDEEAIAQLCDIDKRNVKKALDALRKDYDSRDTALMVIQEGNSWKINVREKYLSLVRKIVSDTELSKSIMETLAVVAWKTPIYQNEVVKIRGNKCYDHIEELVNTGFITKEKKGRSYILKTTEKFYNYFDIDQKNLQGVMNEAKLPMAQTTLVAEEKPVEQTYSREKLIQALETIETKSIVQSDEEKSSQKEFLDKIHQKIEDSAKRTDEVIAEIPKPMHHEEQPPIVAEHVPPEIKSDNISSKDDEIIIDTGIENGTHHFQKAEEQPQKVKQLTKKQLEKKFKEELQRVKEMSDQKK